MKSTTVAVFCVLALSAGISALELPPELKEIIDAAHESCRSQTGVDEAVLNEAMKGKLTDDAKLKCFIKCMFMSLQAMKDDGSLDLELIEASMPAEVKAKGAMDSLKQCLPTPGTELCQSAYNVMACMNRVNPDLAKLFE